MGSAFSASQSLHNPTSLCLSWDYQQALLSLHLAQHKVTTAVITPYKIKPGLGSRKHFKAIWAHCAMFLLGLWEVCVFIVQVDLCHCLRIASSICTGLGLIHCIDLDVGYNPC